MMDKNIIFLLTYCEADEWVKFAPPSKFIEQFSKYKFIVLDNGDQPVMEQWCKDTDSIYYGAEQNIGSSGGYNWIFRVASLLKCKRAGLLQADVEILDVEKVLDVLFDNKWQDNEIPFWPQVPKAEWDIYDPGQVYNLGQIFSFNPDYILSNDFLVDENYVVTHFDDADLARRMRDGGMKLHNQMLNLDVDIESKATTHTAPNYYTIHHISSSNSGNHEDWLKYNEDYHNEKWFKEVDVVAWDRPFGNDNDLNYRKPHSKRWTDLHYLPYPVEHEVNRFYNQYPELFE